MAMKAVHRSSGDAIADRRYAYAAAAFVDADWQVAVDLAGQTLELTPRFVPAYVMLGRAQAALGRKEEAIAALNEALELDPEDELGARIDLARLGAMSADEAISESYVRALFDSYAEGFEAHLTGQLAYRGPAILRRAIAEACAARGREASFALAIDLGCGTGLMGKELAAIARRIEGVDISPKMIAVAARSGLYAALNVGEVVDELDRRPAASADLIVAADVVVYIGDLFPLFREAARVLEPGGLFAFTAQALQDQAHTAPGFELGVDSRYSHADDYLHSVAEDSGLVTALFQSASTRQDRGLDVPGFVMVLTRAG